MTKDLKEDILDMECMMHILATVVMQSRFCSVTLAVLPRSWSSDCYLTSRDASVLVDWRLETAEGTYNTANMNLQVG